jgi:flagellar biosynthesis anti-sigma factor FlgM
MTNAINPYSRQAPADSPLRKALDQASKRESLAASSVGGPAPLETDVAVSKSAAASKGAEVAGFKAINDRLKQEPDFDRTKVESIKKAIESGHYPLNPRRIAESFVALEQLISN